MSEWQRKKCRFIEQKFAENVFKPIGIPMGKLEQISIGHDEVEALKLVDLDGMKQAEAAEKMGISAATIQRIIERARSKVADALVNGKAVVIEGGFYEVKNEDSHC